MNNISDIKKMSLLAQNFRAIGIKGQGSIFNIIDSTPITGGLALTALTSLKTITIGTGWALNVGNLLITEPGGLNIGPLTLNTNGDITYNNSLYIHVTTLPAGSTPSNLGVGISTLNNVEVGGDHNTAVGIDAMENNTTGSSNVSVGHNSMNACITGSTNVAVGRDAASALTTGSRNTLIGHSSGSSLTSEDNCILLNNDGSTALNGEIHLGNASDHSLTFLHCPLVTGRMTSSTGSAAIPVTSCYHEITTTGADSFSLADGTPGQHIVITMVGDGGNADITPDNYAGGVNFLLQNVGDAVHLMFSATSGWVYLGGVANLAP